MEFVDLFVQNCISIMSQFGIFAGVILILLESILPVLPLSVFITLNLMTYGDILGFLISWITTIIGCTCSFFLFRSIFRDRLYRFITRRNHEELEKWMKAISQIKFTNLVIILAIPFTPAFFINIAAGLSKMRYRKFFFALLIGKLVMVYFWGYVGTSLLESITDVSVLLRIAVLLLIAYLLSRFMEKKLHVK